MKQKVITPNCPRCHGDLWAVPCPLGEGCEHFECTACGVEWVYRGQEWIRFDDNGQVLEVLTPRVPRFRKNKPLTSV